MYTKRLEDSVVSRARHVVTSSCVVGGDSVWKVRRERVSLCFVLEGNRRVWHELVNSVDLFDEC